MKKSRPKTLYPKPYPLNPYFGFTLIEVLVSVTIIIILMGIGVVRYNSMNKRGRDQKRRTDIIQLTSALTAYRNDRTDRLYPTTTYNGLRPLLFPRYISPWPQDPVPGCTYVYWADSGGAEYEIWYRLENLPPGTSPSCGCGTCNAWEYSYFDTRVPLYW